MENQTIDFHIDDLLSALNTSPVEVGTDYDIRWRTVGTIATASAAALGVSVALPVVIPSATAVGGGAFLGGMMGSVPGVLTGAAVGAVGIATGGTAFAVPALLVSTTLGTATALPGGFFGGSLVASLTSCASPTAVTLAGLGFTGATLAGVLVLIKLWNVVHTRYGDVQSFLSHLKQQTDNSAYTEYVFA